MNATIDALSPADDAAALKLWAEAFGEQDHGRPPSFKPSELPGRRIHVAKADGELVGAAIDREYTSWWGGAEVSTAGIAGVAVRAEHRGTGLLTPLFDACLNESRERGALVSTMFPTAAGIYRRLGYEVVGHLDDVEVPTADLAVNGDTVPVRRATLADVPAIRAAYTRWASQQHGPLTRTGPSFPATDSELLDDFSGITVAEAQPGHITGYVSCKRGEGYGSSARIRVADLIADDRASLRSLMRTLASNASVAPSTVIRTSGYEPWRHLLGKDSGTIVHRDPYAFAVLDVRAFEAMTYPEGISAELPFRWNDRDYVLSVTNTRGHINVEPVGVDARTLSDAGIALAFARSQTASGQRTLGYLTGSTADDSTWNALLNHRFAIRDYF